MGWTLIPFCWSFALVQFTFLSLIFYEIPVHCFCRLWWSVVIDHIFVRWGWCWWLACFYFWFGLFFGFYVHLSHCRMTQTVLWLFSFSSCFQQWSFCRPCVLYSLSIVGDQMRTTRPIRLTMNTNLNYCLKTTILGSTTIGVLSLVERRLRETTDWWIYIHQ